MFGFKKIKELAWLEKALMLCVSLCAIMEYISGEPLSIFVKHKGAVVLILLNTNNTCNLQ